jgi:hypothetical protein
VDQNETAEAVLDRHQPRALWALIGINRCRTCHLRWPCNRWHNARDQRDRTLDDAAIRRMTALVTELYRAGRDAHR